MKRRRIVLLIGLPTVLTLVVGARLLWAQSAITRANAATIHPGMTLADAESILGGPPRHELSNKARLDRETAESEEVGAGEDPENDRAAWQSNDVIVWVCFDGTGRITRVHRTPVVIDPESPLAMLRRWLRL